MVQIQVTFCELETARCILRPMTYDDVPFLFRHFADPSVNLWLVDNEPPATEREARAIAEFYERDRNRTRNRWVIFLKRGGEAIGTCGFHAWQPDHRRAEIGYDISGRFQ